MMIAVLIVLIVSYSSIQIAQDLRQFRNGGKNYHS